MNSPVDKRPARPELGALTSARAFAALQVVLFHTVFDLGGSGMLGHPVLLAILRNGQAAVSFFFVLSGFILTYTYCGTADQTLRGARAKFWRARLARIYPLYFAGFLLDAPRAVAYLVSTTPSRSMGLAKTAVAGGAYLALAQSWFPRVTNAWNTPGWSLSTEAFFYALFPALLWASRRWSGKRILFTAIIAWAAPLIAYAALSGAHVMQFDEGPIVPFWRSFPLLRLPEFFLGVGIGRVYLSGALRDQNAKIRFAGLCACVLIVEVLVLDLGFPAALTENTLAAPLFAVVIFALACNALPATRWLENRVLLALGRASYAVYILHRPLQWWFSAVASHFGCQPSPLLLATYLVSLQLACLAAFRWIEDTARRAITQRA